MNLFQVIELILFPVFVAWVVYEGYQFFKGVYFDDSSDDNSNE